MSALRSSRHCDVTRHLTLDESVMCRFVHRVVGQHNRKRALGCTASHDVLLACPMWQQRRRLSCSCNPDQAVMQRCTEAWQTSLGEATAWCAQFVGVPVILCQESCNARVLVLQGSAVDLRWVSCQHNLHSLQHRLDEDSHD